MNLEDAINSCTDVINTLDAVEMHLEYPFPDAAKCLHDAITLVEEAQYELAQALNEPLDHEVQQIKEESNVDAAVDDYYIDAPE